MQLRYVRKWRSGWRQNYPILLFAIPLVLAALWGILDLLTGDRLFPVRLANYATPWIGILLLSIVGAALALRRHVLAFVAFVLALLIFAPYGGQIGRGVAGLFMGDVAIPKGAVHVMSYNVMGRNPRVGQMVSVIRHHKPDLLLLQEVREPDALLLGLEGLYGANPLYAAVEERLKLVVVSRFPLEKGPKNRYLQETTVRLPGGAVTMFNVDVPRGIEGDADQLAVVDILLGHIDEALHPAILAGDFNFTENNEGYRRIRTRLVNTHETAGRWFGFTFATPQRRLGRLFPLVRIDHMFVSRHFDVVRAQRLSDFGNSDHFPINAILKLEQPGTDFAL